MSTVDRLLEEAIVMTVDAIEEKGLRLDSWKSVENRATLVFALGAEAEREGSASSA